jgi:hypothetical protein
MTLMQGLGNRSRHPEARNATTNLASCPARRLRRIRRRAFPESTGHRWLGAVNGGFGGRLRRESMTCSAVVTRPLRC